MKDIAIAANVVRGLAIDGVQAANSGHPGMPMGAADYATTLFLKHLNYCPDKPLWPDRDRFVLSAGHGVMLQYALLHLAGYGLSLEELKAFRQLGSRTPGHPEYGHTPGVEATTGPLGQGCANVVGMALAERMLAARFNTPEFSIVDHHTYAICSDGDMMEGISHEAFSLAGHLGLHKLIVIYDYNRITIEGRTELAYSDDVRKRFEAYHWNVLEINGHDFQQIEEALAAAGRETKRPTLVIANTHIAHGSPNMQDNCEAHGAPLGANEVRATKKNLGLPEDQVFYVPDGVRAVFQTRGQHGAELAAAWEKRFAAYKAKYPDKAAAWQQALSGALPPDLAGRMPKFSAPIATRSASGKVLQELARAIPNLVGGSADLAPSNKSALSGLGSVGPSDFSGRNLHFGIREHAMAGILNGMALHGGLRVFGATFLVFLDYFRPSVRLAALMGLPVTYVLTHDSIYVGEDGPTHQPVDQLASLRCIPNMTAIRPGDATETAAAWLAALKNTTGPTALLLTRQDLPVLDRTQYPPAASLEKGAYTLWQSAPGKPDLILIASGSELATALEAARTMAGQCRVRVVSMPSWELFDKQPVSYRHEVLPPDCRAKLAVEAASAMGWEKYVGVDGGILAMREFGASGPAKAVAEKFGFTVPAVVAAAKNLLR
jgi:transketolase